MANVQKENGFTPIANELIEAILRYNCPGNQKDVIWALIRMSYGYRRKECELALGYLSRMLNRDRSTISRDVRKLIKRGIISVVRKSDYNNPRLIALNKNYDNWEGFDGKTTVEKNSTVEISSTLQLKKSQLKSRRNLNSTVEETSTIKENNKEKVKENNKKNITQLFPKSIHPIQQFIKDNCSRVSRIEKQLTFNECENLLKEHTEEMVEDVLLALENFNNIKKYVSVNLTVRNWLSKSEKNKNTFKRIAKGEVTDQQLAEELDKAFR